MHYIKSYLQQLYELPDIPTVIPIRVKYHLADDRLMPLKRGMRCVSTRRPTATSNHYKLGTGHSLYAYSFSHLRVPMPSMASISMARESLRCQTWNSLIVSMVQWCVSLVHSCAINYVHGKLGCLRNLQTSSLTQ